MFDSRESAGALLGDELKRRGIVADVVFGLARGGVVVAAGVASILNAPLVPLVVRKIGSPGNEEFAIGAISEIPGTDRTMVWWNEQAIQQLGVDERWKTERAEKKKTEVLEYKKKLNKQEIPENTKRPRMNFRKNNEVQLVLVDDGAATGASMLAAIYAARQTFPHSVITIALPVASVNAAEEFRTVANDVVILHEDPELGAVGAYYRQFPQVEWEEVRALL